MSNLKIYGSNNKPLTVQVISDTHYYSRKSGTTGSAYQNAEAKSQKVIKDTDLVIDAAWNLLLQDTSTDIVLLSGDTTKDGEIDSHNEFIEKLRQLKAKGKRVYVITATHDYRQIGYTDGYDGDNTYRVPAAKREDLWDLYYEFGPNEAISYHKPSMCYVVQLCDGYRLFALNDDTDLVKGSGFSEDCTKWILEQLNDAKEHNQYVIAMTHHPMLSPSPFYSIIGKGDMQANHMDTVKLFADNGLHCILTGHTHIHDISQHQTEMGNVFYDITTASLVGYPPTIRNITFDPKNANIHVQTKMVEDVPGLDMNGKKFPEYVKDFFIGMISEVLWAAANDIDKLSDMTTAFSIPSEKVKKIGWLIKPPAKFINKLTFKSIYKWTKKETKLKLSDIEKIKDRKVVDFILEMVTNLYGGDAPYSPNTPEYKMTIGMLNVIDSFLSTIHFDIGKILKGANSVRSLVEPLLYNAGPCDAEADLKIFGLNTDKNAAIEKLEENKVEKTVNESKKGPAILLILILLAVIFSVAMIVTMPITLPIGLIVFIIYKLKK